MNLYDIIDEFKALGHYEDEQIEDRIVQFYTDLNTDGRFLNVGENIGVYVIGIQLLTSKKNRSNNSKIRHLLMMLKKTKT